MTPRIEPKDWTTWQLIGFVVTAPIWMVMAIIDAAANLYGEMLAETKHDPD